MLDATTFAAGGTPSLVYRVREAIDLLGGGRVWARSSGHHVILGLRGQEAFARVTSFGGGAYGLALRAVSDPSRPDGPSTAWEPLLLVDELQEVVEHALVAVDAIPADA